MFYLLNISVLYSFLRVHWNVTIEWMKTVYIWLIILSLITSISESFREETLSFIQFFNVFSFLWSLVIITSISVLIVSIVIMSIKIFQKLWMWVLLLKEKKKDSIVDKLFGEGRYSLWANLFISWFSIIQILFLCWLGFICEKYFNFIHDSWFLLSVIQNFCSIFWSFCIGLSFYILLESTVYNIYNWFKSTNL